MIYDAKSGKYVEFEEFERRNGKHEIDERTIEFIRGVDEHMHGSEGWDAQREQRKNARFEKIQRDKQENCVK